MLRLVAIVFLLGVTCFRVSAQTADDRIVRALDLALDLEHGDRAALLAEINKELLAILAANPGSDLARSLLAPGPARTESVIQRVQAQIATVPAAVTCPGPERVGELARLILKQRVEVPGFGSADYGTLESYLLVQYEGLETAQALALMSGTTTEAARPPRMIEKLAAAFAISRLGVDEGFRAVGQSTEDGFAGGDVDVWRAIVMTDGGQRFFELFEKTRADPERSKRFTDAFANGFGLAMSLIDAPDEVRLNFASAAEAAGQLGMAALTLASLSDRAEFRAFVARNIADDRIKRFNPDLFGLSELLQKTPTQPEPGQTFRPWSQGIFDIFRAGLLLGEMDYLNILFNMTGWEQELAPAAAEFLAGIDAGTRSPVGHLEENWVFLHDRIAARADPVKLQLHLGGFDISKRVRHYAGGSALSALDWMRAGIVITPYLRGESPSPPPRPELISDSFDWIAWTQAASAVRAGLVPQALDEQQGKMVAEQLLLAGRMQDAVQFAIDRMEPAPRLSFLRDLMLRVDRQCKAVTAVPGQSMMLGGMVAYRF